MIKYEMKDWLGTPRLTYSDIKRPDDPTVEKFYYTYKLDYLSATTTYPFGAEIEELSFENSQYRFGFTGHEIYLSGIIYHLSVAPQV